MSICTVLLFDIDHGDKDHVGQNQKSRHGKIYNSKHISSKCMNTTCICTYIFPEYLTCAFRNLWSKLHANIVSPTRIQNAPNHNNSISHKPDMLMTILR